MIYKTYILSTELHLQLGDDSKDVKVGTLIALIAESGEDWKAVQSNGSTSSAAVTPTVPISPPATPVQATTSSSIQHATKQPT
jgi:pyruvate/2-oxoglutarate dehydrogenase complex dihydrolipoamide acyltransferase (E2) component